MGNRASGTHHAGAYHERLHLDIESCDESLLSPFEWSIIDVDGARLIVITAAVAGVRVSEALGLQLGDIGPNETLRVERRQHRGDIADPRRIRQIGSLTQQLLKYGAGKRLERFIFQRKDGRLLDDRDLQQHVFRPLLKPPESTMRASGCTHSAGSM